jgi:hypothetical protein
MDVKNICEHFNTDGCKKPCQHFKTDGWTDLWMMAVANHEGVQAGEKKMKLDPGRSMENRTVQGGVEGEALLLRGRTTIR